MASVNKVILIGNLGDDPELRYTTEGKVFVANVSLATSYSWKDPETGQRREETEWHRVIFYGKQADVVGRYLKKGSRIYTEGRLKTRKFEDKNQTQRYITEVIAERMHMLDSKNNDATAKTTPKAVSTNQPSGVSSIEEDIPF